MTENKRYRVFKYIDCEKYGVSDDVAEYTLARFDNHFEAEGLCDLLNELAEENEQLKKELKEFKDYVFSDEEILCYSCVNCISKGIYEVECSEKGKVDVHGTCFSYWKNEVEE